MGEPALQPGEWRSAGLTLRYVAAGPESAPPLIIHHGFLDHGRSWAPVIAALADRYRVIAVDARGHGDSDWIGAGGAYTFPDYVLDLHNLQGQLGAEQVVLVGHSMGGGVTSYYAGTFPERVRALVLVEGIGPPRQPFEQAPDHLRAFVETTTARQARREHSAMAHVGEAAERLLKWDPLLPRERADQLAELGTTIVPGGVAWKWDPLHRARIGTPYVVEHAMAIWRRITCPTLLIGGGRSRLALPDAEQRIAAFAHGETVIIDDAGHNVHLHAPETLTSTVRDFLHRTCRSPST